MKKHQIIGIVIGASVLAICSAAIPVGILVSKQVAIFNQQFKEIKGVTASKDFQDFLMEYEAQLIQANFNDLQAAQDFVDAKINDWKQWMLPVNNLEGYSKNALVGIDSIKVKIDEASNQHVFDFDFVWKDGYKISDHLKTTYSFKMKDPAPISWRISFASATASIQEKVDEMHYELASGEKLSAAIIQENLQLKQLAIINLLNEWKDVRKFSLVVLDTSTETKSEFSIIPIFAMYDYEQFGILPDDENVIVVKGTLD